MTDCQMTDCGKEWLRLIIGSNSSERSDIIAYWMRTSEPSRCLIDRLHQELRRRSMVFHSSPSPDYPDLLQL